jgi:hypothetical protein
LSVDPGVEVVVGDDLCGWASTICSVVLTWIILSMTGMIQLKARTGEAPVLSESLDESLVRGADNSDAREKDH